MAAAVPSFLLGVTVALYARLDDVTGHDGRPPDVASSSSFRDLESVIASRVARAVETQKEEWKKTECYGSSPMNTQKIASSDVLLDPRRVGNYVQSVAVTPKANLTSALDLGVPLDPSTKRGSTHALILYMKADGVAPRGRVASVDDATAALEPCDTVNVLLTDHSGQRRQCLAVVPNYESFHLQHWMRVDETRRRSRPDAPLRLVGRGLKGANGRDEFAPPSTGNAQKAVETLRRYFDSLDAVLAELKVILRRIADPNNTVIVMVCNFGQSELLMNFLCQARARALDVSNLIVFATDRETHDAVTAMGVTAYHDTRNFGDLPLEAAHRYGDRYFTAMMLAKVVCVQLVASLGYSFLFQDVDLVWYRNPLEHFTNLPDDDADFDVYFQDDGGHSLRYAPYRYVYQRSEEKKRT